jgi:hypothetical protein
LPLALSRRQFLTAAAGAAGAAQIRGLAHAGPIAATSPALSADWPALARMLQGTLLRPGEPDFTRIASPWNLRFASTVPAGIARCASPDDVAVSVLWAQRNEMPLAIRSGGHSYAGFSTTGGLMIDVSPMHSVSAPDRDGRVRVGGGARNANVAAVLRGANRSITHGRCKDVGVAGLVLGGGIGFNQRRFGLACDQLAETEIVIAAGERLVCNAEQNPDLFWACRGGGGGNFGVNVSLTFQTFLVGDYTFFKLGWREGAGDVLPAALELLPSMPDRLGCRLRAEAGQDVRIELLGQLAGSPEELTELLSPLYRVAKPSEETKRLMPYWDAQEPLAEEGAPEYAHERSRYVFEPLSQDAIATMLDFLRRWPVTHAGAEWKMFLAGGAVAAVAPAATAFVHRKAIMLSAIDLTWTEDDDAATVADNESWLGAFHDAMRSFTSDECFQNFTDGAEPNYLRAYYGENLERLAEVKRRYDPENLFSFPQSIPLAL